MRMRRWSRAVALLCIVYLVVLLFFHRHLGPVNDAMSEDYADVRGEQPDPHIVTSNNSARTQVQRPEHLQQQLRQLEVGLTQLEKEISKVKLKLLKTPTTRSKTPEERKDGQKRDGKNGEFRGHHVPLQTPFPPQRNTGQQQQQNPQARLEYLEAGNGKQYEMEEKQQTVRRLRQQPEKFFRQPFNDRMLPVNFPQHPKGGPVDDPEGEEYYGLEATRAEKATPSPKEDYTNSSLVEIGEGVAVYAAYHDDRMMDKPAVRLIMVVSAPKPQRQVLCHYDVPDSTSVISVEAEQYELCENHKKKYLGFIYSCPLPAGFGQELYRIHLSLLNNPAKRMTLPVLHVTPPDIQQGKVTEESHKYKYNFSICVSPLFGSVMAKRLVEFLELSRILGVEQVFFYDFQVSSIIERVLRYYQDKGWVTVLPWKLPSAMDNSNIWYHGQLVTNNDCLYRTMALSAFTAFHDIDEFIVPHAEGVRTLGQLFPTTFPNDTCGYSFKSAFYDPGMASQFPDDLMTMALNARPEMLSKVRTKVMVAPRRVFEVGIHHISKQLREHWLPRPYDPDLALLHHYRECIRDYGMRCEKWVKDTIIKDKYMPELKDNFLQVIKMLQL